MLPVHRRLVPCLSSIVLLTSIAACGPTNDSTAYIPTEDTVTSTASITLDGNSKTIRITSKGPTVQSETIEECSIGFDKESLSFSFPSADALMLNDDALEYVRPLSQPEAAAGVDSRLFAVWKVPAYMVQLVSYRIEVEIHKDRIIYRNTCVR